MKQKEPQEPTAEQRVSLTLLQQDTVVQIGPHLFRIKPISYGTFIAASAAISRIPELPETSDNPVADIYHHAKDCHATGEAIATLLVGAKGATRHGLRHLLWRMRVRRKTAYLLEKLSAKELALLYKQIEGSEDYAYFFALTTSLKGQSLTKPTREVETTAPGR